MLETSVTHMECKHTARNSCTLPKPQETDRSKKNEYEQGSNVEWKWQCNLASEVRAGSRGRHDSSCGEIKEEERSADERDGLC